MRKVRKTRCSTFPWQTEREKFSLLLESLIATEGKKPRPGYIPVVDSDWWRSGSLECCQNMEVSEVCRNLRLTSCQIEML